MHTYILLWLVTSEAVIINTICANLKLMCWRMLQGHCEYLKQMIQNFEIYMPYFKQAHRQWFFHLCNLYDIEYQRLLLFNVAHFYNVINCCSMNLSIKINVYWHVVYLCFCIAVSLYVLCMEYCKLTGIFTIRTRFTGCWARIIALLHQGKFIVCQVNHCIDCVNLHTNLGDVQCRRLCKWVFFNTV